MIKILTTVAIIILSTSYSFASRILKHFDSVETFVCASSVYYDGKHEPYMQVYQVSDFKLIENFSTEDATFNVYRTELNDGKRTRATFGSYNESDGRLIVEMEDYSSYGEFSSSQWEKCIVIN